MKHEKDGLEEVLKASIRGRRGINAHISYKC